VDQVEILLALDAAMPDGREQARIVGGEAGQSLGVVAIVLGIGGGDGADLARVGDDGLVAEAFQQTADPGRMSAGFKRDAHPRFPLEVLAESGFGGLNTSLFEPISILVENAIMAETIAQIKANGQVRFRRRNGGMGVFAKLLHGWSPFAPRVRADRVSLRETSRLIPSKSAS
jgi:hypothetical protein